MRTRSRRKQPVGKKVYDRQSRGQSRRRRSVPYEVKPVNIYPVETLPPSLPISKIPVTCAT